MRQLTGSEANTVIKALSNMNNESVLAVGERIEYAFTACSFPLELSPLSYQPQPKKEKKKWK